ncbi:hypothetical protein SNK04_010125 [Fusarium graminearum]
MGEKDAVTRIETPGMSVYDGNAGCTHHPYPPFGGGGGTSFWGETCLHCLSPRLRFADPAAGLE